MAKYDRDYVTTIPLLEEKANEYSEGKWNKYEDIGEALIKFLACTSHTVDYYFRKYLDALLLPNDDWNQKSLVWELTGYKPPYSRADYMMAQLYWPDCGLLTYVPLYMYTPFRVYTDGDVYVFLCAEDYLIPPMTTKINIKLVQGELRRIEQDYLKISDNKIKLCEEEIDYDLVTLTVSGVKWTQVRNVFYSPDTERIFSLHKEEDGIYLYLHKSWESYIDEYDTSFYIDFIVSDLSFNDVTEECIKIEIASALLDTNGVDVSQFYHIYPMPNSDTGVVEQPSTIEGERVITTDDYTAKAELYPGVAAAKAYSWDSNSVTRSPFEVKVVAAGFSGILRKRTKEALVLYLKSVGSKLIDVSIVDPIFLPIDLMVLLDIGDYLGTLIEIQIRLLMQQALEEFFKIGNLPPGYKVTVKELNSLLLHVDQRMVYVETTIRTMNNSGPTIIPILGNVSIITEATILPKYDVGYVTEKITVANAVYVDDSGKAIDKAGVYTVYQSLRERPQVHYIMPIDKDLIVLKDSHEFTETLKLPLKEVTVKELLTGTYSFGEDSQVLKLIPKTYEFSSDKVKLFSDIFVVEGWDASLQPDSDVTIVDDILSVTTT